MITISTSHPTFSSLGGGPEGASVAQDFLIRADMQISNTAFDG